MFHKIWTNLYEEWEKNVRINKNVRDLDLLWSSTKFCTRSDPLKERIDEGLTLISDSRVWSSYTFRGHLRPCIFSTFFFFSLASIATFMCLQEKFPFYAPDITSGLAPKEILRRSTNRANLKPAIFHRFVYFFNGFIFDLWRCDASSRKSIEKSNKSTKRKYEVEKKRNVRVKKSKKEFFSAVVIIFFHAFSLEGVFEGTKNKLPSGNEGITKADRFVEFFNEMP